MKNKQYKKIMKEIISIKELVKLANETKMTTKHYRKRRETKIKLLNEINNKFNTLLKEKFIN